MSEHVNQVVRFIRVAYAIRKDFVCEDLKFTLSGNWSAWGKNQIY